MDARIKTAKGPTILLHSGAYFDLLDPWNSQFTIEDIAHGLSNTCRYAGQCNAFYSVAEHSWHASYIVPGPWKLAALMHDAAEAFIGDVTRPLKSLLPDYKQIERGVEDAIAARFGIYGMDAPAVKAVDLALLAAEQAEIMPPHADSWAVLDDVIPMPVNLRMWQPEAAKKAFLDRYHQLVVGEAPRPPAAPVVESIKPSTDEVRAAITRLTALSLSEIAPPAVTKAMLWAYLHGRNDAFAPAVESTDTGETTR